MKPTTHPQNSDFPRIEVFDSREGVGLTFMRGLSTERMSEDEWREVAADVAERFAAKRAKQQNEAA